MEVEVNLFVVDAEVEAVVARRGDGAAAVAVVDE